jgi:MipA family protein
MISSFFARSALRLLVLAGLFLSSFCSYADEPATEASEASATVLAFGAGVERMPKWLGATQSKNQAIPYFDINWQDRVELSSTDGLIIDLIHAKPWHGGLIGSMVWGRSDNDLGELAKAVPTLNNTIQGGAYVEYDFTKELTTGVRLSHDIQSTGAAYGDVYADLDLPGIWLVEHSLKFDMAFMNQSAMRRNFGLSSEAATALNVSAYSPSSGLESATLTYQAFVPTSRSTGFVLGAAWSSLAGRASESPLVRSYGSKIQRTYMAAFLVHF